MIRRVSFTVTGSPQPQPRPRMTRKGHVFTPPTAAAWKQAVRDAWALQGEAPFPGAVEILATFTLVRPASHWRKSGGLTASAPVQATGRPDTDNLLKAVMDALGDAGAYPNDAAVVRITASKSWQVSPMTPAGCEIILLHRDP